MFVIPPLNPGRSASSQGHWGTPVVWGIPGVPGSVQTQGYGPAQIYPGVLLALAPGSGRHV